MRSYSTILQISLVGTALLSACAGASQESAHPAADDTAVQEKGAGEVEAAEEGAVASDGPTEGASAQEGGAQGAKSDPDARVPATPAPGSPMDQFMRAHAKDAELIRRAIIKGEPQEAGKPADSLIHLLDEEQLPSSWNAPVERMLASTRRVKDSSDTAGAAAALADVGTSCGWCHQRLGGPSPSFSEAPEDDGSLAARMRRHVWATERLWEGLYAPSSRAWKAGAQVLKNASFPKEVLDKGGVYAKSAAKEFGKVAVRIPKVHRSTDRAAVYAELLGTCASCHQAIKN